MTRAAPSPHLRCDVCGRKKPLSDLTGEPGLLLFCSGSALASALCTLRSKKNRKAKKP